MRDAILAMVGGLALSGCVATADSNEDGLPVSKSAPEAEQASPASTDDWLFKYDEAREEVTARRGAAELVYPLREMGAE